MKMRSFVSALALILITAGVASADLAATLRSLDVHARADLGDVRAEIGARTGASGSDIDLVLRSVDDPAHAVACLWLALQIRQPVEVVIREYRRHRGKGWGALAKSLGIKPGSPAFHALKQGNLGWQPAGSKKSKGKGRGKGRS